MTTILGISGSLRRASLNTALLRAIAAAAPAGVRIEMATLHGIPLYDGDIEESEGVPPAVALLKERVAANEALLLVTPEYNNAMPGVFKNAIDWLSRPPKDIPRIFRGRPVAVVGASPGGFGTLLAQTAWLPVLRTLGTRPWFGPRLAVSRAGSVFDAEGNLADEKVREQVAAFVAGFAAFIAKG
jgi:chromate reductase, NAD(P)H dehydrogenase (quinone)